VTATGETPDCPGATFGAAAINTSRIRGSSSPSFGQFSSCVVIFSVIWVGSRQPNSWLTTVASASDQVFLISVGYAHSVDV